MGNMHHIEALSVLTFVCLSESWSVGPSIGPLVGSPAGPSTGYALYRGFVSALFCLSVCLSVCQSVGPSIGPLIGSPAGPSTGWMHPCLPVRLVFFQLEPQAPLSLVFSFDPH